LVADDATANAGLIGFAQSAITLASQLTETMLRIDPESQIEIAAFMPDLDALLAELPESWDLLPQRLCDRADHGDRLNLGKTRPSLRHHVRGDPELALAPQHETVLFLYLGAPHELTPAAS
jgi:hypothetical protein